MSFFIIPIGIILVGIVLMILGISSIVKDRICDFADALTIGLGVLVIIIGVVIFRLPF